MTCMVKVEPIGGVEYDPDRANGGVGSVKYKLDSLWIVTVTREFGRPAGGPTELTVRPILGDEAGDIGGYDSVGIQQADLRAIPITEARRRLEAAWIEHRAAALIQRIPENFEGDYAFAVLARAVVTLHGWNVRNPVGVIARNRQPNTHGTWATRVKRARERGFMTAGTEPSLTGKALALLQD